MVSPSARLEYRSPYKNEHAMACMNRMKQNEEEEPARSMLAVRSLNTEVKDACTQEGGALLLITVLF